MDFALALWGAAVQDASTWSIVATVTINVLLVILGINALIIVHELGHFIVARLCGVRCDKFYIWFDFWGLRFFRFRWGRTEYGLGVFPLGGYVKMLGQEDNPGELRAEMERARQTQAERLEIGHLNDEQPNVAAEAEEMTEAIEADMPPTRSVEELNDAIYAPDSYLAKSVPQRMAIIVAGVVMNFLFAIVCATGAYMVGVKETAPAVGNVIPGSPAWAADLQVGDRIVGINGKRARVFTDINMAMVGGEDGVTLEIERGSGTDAQRIEKTLQPRKRKNDLAPSIGVVNLGTLEFASPKKPVYGWAEKHYSPETLDALKKPDLVLRSVDGVPVENYAAYLDEQLKYFDKPIVCRVSTKGVAGDAANGDGVAGDVSKGVAGDAANRDSTEATLSAIPMKTIGVRFKMGGVTMVLPGSDAEKQGIRPGDVILGIDGETGFDPLKLPQIVLRKLNEGRETVELLVRQGDAEPRTLTVRLAPRRIIPKLGPLSMKDPVGSTALGLAWNVEPEIAGIEPEASEAVRGLPVGGQVLSVKFVNAEALLKGTTFSEQEKDGFLLKDVGGKIDVPYIFAGLLQEAAPAPLTEAQKKKDEKEKTVFVRLQVKKPDGTVESVELPVYDAADWFHTDRGLILKAETALVKIDDFGEALSMGTAKMVEYSMSVFTFLHRLFSGGISPRALGGPVMIVQAAYMFVERGMGSYLLFLCLIGANLAVINILPIPVLDGGHLVFLLYEGIFRRPPNETVQVVLSYIGLFLILALMVWAVSLDVGCIKRL